ncbi:MAG: class I SAM-dependent methyltransferase [Patescibacteria group bacterium]
MTAKKSPASDYPKEAYALLVDREERHFWFRGRNHAIRSIITKYFPKPLGKRFLEVGCGTGYVLRELAAMGFRVTGLDMHGDGIRYARKRVPSATFVVGDLFDFKPAKKFDAVGIFDVIEHIAHATKALERCRSLLNPGGMLFVTVPARSELWSAYDTISGHKRRYTKAALIEALEKSGYTVRFVGYLGFFQYLPHFLVKKLLISPAHTDDTMAVLEGVLRMPAAPLNRLLLFSMRLDTYLTTRIALPFGTTLIACAQKAV